MLMKRCIVCGKEAKYAIKGTNNYYCSECAEELFSDLSVLIDLEKTEDIVDDVINSIDKLKNDQEFLDKFVKKMH